LAIAATNAILARIDDGFFHVCFRKWPVRTAR
jgi:hypothetical protein